ncbi:hypothetical protein EMGR_000867 [Emarellia grisea]
MHSPCTYYDRAPSFAGRGRRFFRQNYYVCGPNPRAGGIGGLVKVALVATATYFVCKKIYQGLYRIRESVQGGFYRGVDRARIAGRYRLTDHGVLGGEGDKGRDDSVSIYGRHGSS